MYRYSTRSNPGPGAGVPGTIPMVAGPPHPIRLPPPEKITGLVPHDPAPDLRISRMQSGSPWTHPGHFLAPGKTRAYSAGLTIRSNRGKARGS